MSQQDDRLAISVKKQCTDIKIVDPMQGRTHVYKLPLKMAPSNSGVPSTVKRFSFGESNQRLGREQKAILLMGATGSGKTTMINAMINFILGVEWEDDFRFMLVEEEVKGASQANSQTQGVTAYDLHYQNGFRIPFSLTIVDTPGFGDTGGIGRDKEITSAIQQLFEHSNGIQELNAVGFVVQSALVRLTNSQKHIFSSVLSIFGKDVGKNVRFLVTFADGDPSPPVLEAVKQAKLPCLMDSTGSPCHQSFNNGAIYKSQKSANNRRFHLDWDDALANFESFFDDISRMETTSLQMTKEVLQDRKELETKLKWMQSAVSAHLSKLAELRTKEAAVELQKERINANQDFEFKIQVSKKVKIPLDRLGALNCKKCETTCHHPCIPGLAFRWCPAFYASVPTLLSPIATLVNTFVNSNCEICTGRCHPDDHAHEKHKWVYRDVEEKQTMYNMRKTYEDAMGEKLTAEKLVKVMKQELEQLKHKIVKAMDCITYLRNNLEENALSRNPLSTTEYIQELIDNETDQHDEGYAERIKSLKELLALAQLTRDIVDNEEKFASQLKLFD